MTRIEKCKIAIEKGITYNPETGKVYGVKGKELISNIGDYSIIMFYYNKKIYYLQAHQFAWYWVNKECVDILDHINQIKTDNRIDNLRSATRSENMWNTTKRKGYTWSKEKNKYQGRITINKKHIHLGYFDNEDDARQAYLTAKEKYHIFQPKQKVNCLNGLYIFNQPYIPLTNNYWAA